MHGSQKMNGQNTEALYWFMRTAMSRRVLCALKKLLKEKEKILSINAGIYMILMKAWQQI